MFSDDKIGHEAANQFIDYWAGFVAANPQCDSAEWRFAISMIYFEGFCNGFDFKTSLIQEITLSN